MTVTHFVDTNIWTAKRETKIKATQLREWCSPFTSETRNWSADDRQEMRTTRDHRGRFTRGRRRLYLSLQAHVVEH